VTSKPAPWRAPIFQKEWTIGDSSEIQTEMNGQSISLATVNSSPHTTPGEQDAIARLLRTAPKMLAALEAAETQELPEPVKTLVSEALAHARYLVRRIEKAVV
jgi:hypothetical protein